MCCIWWKGERNEPQRHTHTEAVLSAWKVHATWAGNRATNTPAADRITVPGRDQFQSTGGLYATWAHEVIHSTGHKSRLNRGGITGGYAFGSDS